MRQAICILTLLVLTGFTATCTPTDYNVTYRVVTANRSSVEIEHAVSRNPNFCFSYACQTYPAKLHAYLLNKAQSECDRYGKDAVLVNEKIWRLISPSPLIISHYRCETR